MFSIDPIRSCVVASQHRIPLSPLELRLLTFLMSKRGEFFARQDIRTAVWGDDEVLDRTVDTHISKLRKKLSPANATIECRYRKGYRVYWGHA